MKLLDEKGVERLWNNVRENFLQNSTLNGIYEEFDLLANALFSEINSIKEQVPVEKLLHNLGHFDSKDSLPSEGQPSGTLGTTPRTISTDPTLSEITIPTSSYPYIFGVILNDSNYLYVATRFPEVIKSMAYGSDGSYEIYFEATAEKPVAVYYKRGSNSGAYCIPDSYTGSYGARDNQRTNGTEVYVPSTLTGYLGGSGTAKIFGNLPNKIKYKAHTYYAYARTSSGTSGYTYNQITAANSDSLTLSFADNYIYNEGMNMLRFDENYQAYWVLANSEVKANDLATVGENNDLYVVNSNGKWEQWHKVDCYTKEEINAMLGEIEDVLDEIITGIPVSNSPNIPDVG